MKYLNIEKPWQASNLVYFGEIKVERNVILACNINFNNHLINGQVVMIMAFYRNDLQLTKIYVKFHEQKVNLKVISNDNFGKHNI